MVYCQSATVLFTGLVAHVLIYRLCTRPVQRPRIPLVMSRVSSATVDCAAACAMSFDACDGEVSPLQMVMIEAHLRQCAACRLRFAGDAVFLRALRAAASLSAAPPSLRERIAQLLLQPAAENAAT